MTWNFAVARASVGLVAIPLVCAATATVPAVASQPDPEPAILQPLDRETLSEFAEFLSRSSRHPPSPVAVSAQFRSVEGKPEIAFTLTNISTKVVQFTDNAVPWASSLSTQFVAITPGGKQLVSSYAPENPVRIETIRLKPGASLQGSLPLSRKIPGIDDFRDDDVIVLWRYRFMDSTDWKKSQKLRVYQDLTGIVVVPKDRK